MRKSPLVCARVRKVEQRPESQSDQPALAPCCRVSSYCTDPVYTTTTITTITTTTTATATTSIVDATHHQPPSIPSSRPLLSPIFHAPDPRRPVARATQGMPAATPVSSALAPTSSSYFAHRRSRRSSPRPTNGTGSRQRWRRHVLATCCISPSATARSYSLPVTVAAVVFNNINFDLSNRPLSSSRKFCNEILSVRE